MAYANRVALGGEVPLYRSFFRIDTRDALIETLRDWAYTRRDVADSIGGTTVALLRSGEDAGAFSLWEEGLARTIVLRTMASWESASSGGVAVRVMTSYQPLPGSITLDRDVPVARAPGFVAGLLGERALCRRVGVGLIQAESDYVELPGRSSCIVAVCCGEGVSAPVDPDALARDLAGAAEVLCVDHDVPGFSGCSALLRRAVLIGLEPGDIAVYPPVCLGEAPASMHPHGRVARARAHKDVCRKVASVQERMQCRAHGSDLLVLDQDLVGAEEVVRV